MHQSEERCCAALCIMLHLSGMTWCLSLLPLPLPVCTSACLYRSHKRCLANKRLAVLRGHDRHFNMKQSQSSSLHSFRALLQSSVCQSIGYVHSKLPQPTHLVKIAHPAISMSAEDISLPQELITQLRNAHLAACK